MTLFDSFLSRTQPVHFWHSRDSIETWSADDLRMRVSSIAEMMRKNNVTAGSTVVLMLPTSIELVVSLLAAWSCRATICIVPHLQQNNSFYHKKMNHIFGLLQPKLLIHNQNENLNYETLINNTKQIHVDELPNQQTELNFPEVLQPNDVAIIQLTSGTTEFPKGVVLKHTQVSANVLDISNRVKINSNDVGLSWLPLYHDMGLSGLLVPMANDFPITLIPTELFVRNPAIWIEAMSQQKATLSKAPVFAYSLVTKQLRRLQKQNIDLSAWRYAWIGAEPIYEKYLKDFQEIMAQFGLRENVLQPAYGLAEAVVSVSSNLPFSPITALSIDADILHKQGRIKIVTSKELDAITLVSNGVPMDGLKVCVRRENGEIADVDEQGIIWISGNSITKNYLNNEGLEKFKDGWFNTGDLGFIYNDEIYISGRAKDLIIRGGVNISSAYIEMIVENELDLRSGKVVAFSYPNTKLEKEEVIVLVGIKPEVHEKLELQKQIAITVRNQAALQVDRIVFIEANKIPKTTSGKIQRSIVKKLFLEDYFTGD
jgi:acyl-CoA synthetase (AMP-forming)/AMP-acid ligase II